MVSISSGQKLGLLDPGGRGRYERVALALEYFIREGRLTRSNNGQIPIGFKAKMAYHGPVISIPELFLIGEGLENDAVLLREMRFEHEIFLGDEFGYPAHYHSNLLGSEWFHEVDTESLMDTANSVFENGKADRREHEELLYNKVEGDSLSECFVNELE